MVSRNGRMHSNRLITSTMDDIALGEAVESRFLDLCEQYIRIKGEQLMIPKSFDNDMLRWRQMRARHKEGDFRNTEAEIQSVKAIAQWTVDVNCGLRNQPYKKVDFRDEKTA